MRRHPINTNWCGQVVAVVLSRHDVGVCPTRRSWSVAPGRLPLAHAWLSAQVESDGSNSVTSRPSWQVIMQRDYILRLIEQSGFILRQLLQRIQAGPVALEERTRELRRAAEIGGLDLDMLRVSDVEGLWHQVALTGEADPARTWLAAETLYADALASEMEGNVAAAVQAYVKAASLFRLMLPTWVLPTGFPEATERVKEVEAKLEALST